jgi:hypothetical protein
MLSPIAIEHACARDMVFAATNGFNFAAQVAVLVIIDVGVRYSLRP